MLTQEDLKQALQKAIRDAGSQNALAIAAGMAQSKVSDYLRGRFRVENITLGTLQRLFPRLEVSFFSSVASLPSPMGCNTAIDRKLWELLQELTEEEKLDLLTEAVALRERRSKKSANPNNSVQNAG